MERINGTLEFLFHDNIVNGEQTTQPADEVISAFISWEEEQTADVLNYYPFRRRFLMFLMEYEPVEGLKHFDIIENEEFEEILTLYTKMNGR